MAQSEYIIDIDILRLPYNSHMVLPMGLLQKLIPVIKDEILKGLVSSDDRGRVILELQLSESKIRKVEEIILAEVRNAA